MPIRLLLRDLRYHEFGGMRYHQSDAHSAVIHRPCHIARIIAPSSPPPKADELRARITPHRTTGQRHGQLQRGISPSPPPSDSPGLTPPGQRRPDTHAGSTPGSAAQILMRAQPRQRRPHTHAGSAPSSAAHKPAQSPSPSNATRHPGSLNRLTTSACSAAPTRERSQDRSEAITHDAPN